ncbi:MAG: AmmeMemoRadiSam system protein B, partial [Thermoproteota archaeon]
MSRHRTRSSSLAGTWYAGTRKSLISQIESLFTGSLGPGSLPKLAEKSDLRLLALMSPHAGYMYSGQAAAWAFWEAAKYGPRDTIIIIGPNHRGIGSPISASSIDRWSTPLGESELDAELTKEI